MADSEPLLSKATDHGHQNHAEIVIPFLLLVVTSTGLTFGGLGNVSLKFGTTGVIYGLLWVAVIVITYWLNSIQIVKACHLHQTYSYSKLFPKLFNETQGRKRGLTVQILMVINNVIILTYLQQRLAANAYKVFNSPANERIEEQTATDIFYYVATANIALILLALQNKYDRVKNFAVITILVWIYLFVGVVAEAWNYTKIGGDISQNSVVSLFPEENAFITTIGLLALFLSYFQIVPYVFGHVKSEGDMKKALLYSTFAIGVFVVSVALYFVFHHNAQLNVIRYTGLTIIVSCVAIINVLPTRDLIIQILEKDAKDKSNTRDRIITVLLLSVTLLLSIGFNDFDFLKVGLGIAVILTSGLGFFFPGWVGFKIAGEKEKNLAIALLAWNIIVGLAVLTAGVFLFLESDHTLELAKS